MIMKKEKVCTRHDEIRYVTSDPKRMLNRFISRNVIKTWEEACLLENGEVATVERSELLFEKGTYIDQDVNAKIRFYMAAGDIKEVEVSNQNRKGTLLLNNFLQLYRAIANISDRKVAFLLYATSVVNAHEILTDYIELNRQGGFFISKIEEVENCCVICDDVDVESARDEINRAYCRDEISGDEYVNAQVDIAGAEPDLSKMSFYQITARITQRDKTQEFEEKSQTFIVHTYTATRANILIEQFLRENEEKRYWRERERHPDCSHEKREIRSFIEEAKILPFKSFIPREFSMAYTDDNEK